MTADLLCDRNLKNKTKLRDDRKSSSESCSTYAYVIIFQKLCCGGVASTRSQRKKGMFSRYRRHTCSRALSHLVCLFQASVHTCTTLYSSLSTLFFPASLPPSLPPSLLPALYICPLILGSAEKLLKSPMKYV